MGFPGRQIGKCSAFWVKPGKWSLKSFVSEKWTLFWGFHHTFLGFPMWEMGKYSIFRVNLGKGSLKLMVLEKKYSSAGFNTHLWGFQEDRLERFNFKGKPSNQSSWTKTSPVLQVSTHIYGVLKQVDGKMFIFLVLPRNVTPQINHLKKQALFWGFQHTCMGFPRK